MIRSSRRSARLAIATALSLGLLWTTTGAAAAAGASAPGGTIFFYRASVPQGLYAVAPDGSGLRAIGCEGDRTRAGAPRRVLRVEPTDGTFVRLSWGAFVQEPVVRLVSTDESCGDAHIIWEPGPGYRLGFPVWSTDGTRIALDVQRYEASGQMIDQGIWVGDVDPTGDGVRALHLAVAQAMVPADPQPPGLTPGMVAYYDATVVPSWAGDGRRVTYGRGADPTITSSPSAIFVADLGPAGTTGPGTERRVAVTGSSGQIYPAFSPIPGDDRIAYVETTSRKGCIRNDIFVVPAAGGTPRQVTTSRNADVCQLMHPEWSPDGRWIAFAANPRSLSGSWIWYIAADGSSKAVAVATTNGGVTYCSPRWRR
jgi:WD40-like Beta Propeller Repeat